MNKKIFLIFIVGMFMLSFVSSLEVLPNAKLGQEYFIKQTCATCSYVNISVSTIDGFVLNNVQMIDNGSGVWIYPYTPNISIRHDVIGEGDLDGTPTSFATYFLVGEDNLTWIIIIYVFAFIFLILSIFVNEELFVYVSGVCFILAGIVIMINGINILNDWTTRAIAFISIGLGFVFSLGAYIYNLYDKNSEEEY